MKKISKRTKKWMIIGGIAIVIIFLLVRGCSMGSVAMLGTETAEVRDIATFYSYSGVVDARNKQNIVAPGGNLSVERIYVDEGDYVHVGDILLAFEATDLENNVASATAQVEIARINYENAQSTGQAQSVAQGQASLTQAEISFRDAELNLERMQGLFESGAISQSQLEQAQTAYNNANAQLQLARVNNEAATSNAGQSVRSARAQYEQARANLSNAQHALDNRIIKAEVDGIVADIYAQEGITLTMGESVMDVVDYDDLILEIKVDEYEIAAITEGKEVDVYVNALDRDTSGYISRIANQATRVGDLSYFVTEIQLTESNNLRVGLSVEMRVPNVDRRGVVTVSMGAVQFDLENMPYVLVGDSSNPTRKNVQVGQNDGIIVEITEGLAAGDVVLVQRSGGMQMVPGSGPVDSDGRAVMRDEGSGGDGASARTGG